MLAAVRELGGEVALDLNPQETDWAKPLDEDDEHATIDPGARGDVLRGRHRAARVLTALRAPYRGRSTPVNAWWGSFDLAVSLFSGRPAEPPSGDFIMRNAMDAEEIAVGWWPGDERYPHAAFYAYAHPAPTASQTRCCRLRAARWDASLGEFVLDWDDVVATADPYGAALEFARSAVRHACVVCSWDPALAASARGIPAARQMSHQSPFDRRKSRVARTPARGLPRMARPGSPRMCATCGKIGCSRLFSPNRQQDEHEASGNLSRASTDPNEGARRGTSSTRSARSSTQLDR